MLIIFVKVSIFHQTSHATHCHAGSPQLLRCRHLWRLCLQITSWWWSGLLAGYTIDHWIGLRENLLAKTIFNGFQWYIMVQNILKLIHGKNLQENPRSNGKNPWFPVEFPKQTNPMNWREKMMGWDFQATNRPFLMLKKIGMEDESVLWT